jgi:hypothetical protein
VLSSCPSEDSPSSVAHMQRVYSDTAQFNSMSCAMPSSYCRMCEDEVEADGTDFFTAGRKQVCHEWCGCVCSSSIA